MVVVVQWGSYMSNWPGIFAFYCCHECLLCGDVGHRKTVGNEERASHALGC